MKDNHREIRRVTLSDVLSARERRAGLQAKLLQEYKKPVLSFTMNIAGPVKNTSLIERAFEYGLRRIRGRIPSESVICDLITKDFCGCEAMMTVDLDPEVLKKICVNIEEESYLGRLFDMDVIDSCGKKLDRKVERACIVCGKEGRECSAGRLHSVDEIVSATNKIMTDHFAKSDPERIGRLAAECLIKEVETTPKPGLVDLRNNGSHTDMDVSTFRKSANALIPYFTECVKIGIDSQNLDVESTFDRLRAAGLIADATMYETTGGVNTHKGAIYSMGVLLGAIGRLWSAELPIADRKEILAQASKLVKESVDSDLNLANGSTAGERLYLERGLKGIRGEVASGFVSVLEYALPVYESEMKKGASQNDSGVRTLLSLIFSIDDTNLYHRGGEEGVRFAKERAKDLLFYGYNLADVEKMDDDFIERRLSPGGSADLLAVTYLLFDLENYK